MSGSSGTAGRNASTRRPVLPSPPVEIPRSLALATGLTLATGLALLGCSGHTPATAPEASPPRPPRGDATADSSEPRYVLLRDGATLASGMDPTADTARAFDSPREAPLTRMVWIMRLRERYGDWLEVETIEPATAQTHCATALTGLDALVLRLYVRADDALTVTAREVAVTLPGGNRVTLGPGVRVT